jgi:hypothetical protein
MNRTLVLRLIGSVRGRAAAVAKTSDEYAVPPRKHSPEILFLPYSSTRGDFRPNAVWRGLVEAVQMAVPNRRTETSFT